MTAAAAHRPAGFQIGWRSLECWGVGAALLFQTSGIILLLFFDAEGGLSAGDRKILQLLVLPVYLMTLVLAARHPRQILGALRGNIPVALMLALPFVSVLWSVSPTITLRRAIGLLLSVLLAYVIAVRFTPRQFLVLVVVVLGICMGLSLALGVAHAGLAYMPDGSALRGVFNHKNVLGWNAAIGALAAGALAADRAHPGLRRTGIVVLVASLACLLLSQSTTALVTALSAAFFAAFYGALTRTRGAGRIVLILAALQVFALMLVSVDVFLGALLEGTDKDASFTGRVPLWALVDEAIQRRLLLGYGYQAFWTEGNGDAWAIWSRVNWLAPHAHNGFRDSLLNSGLVGTALLLLVIARAIRNGALLQCRSPGEGWLWLNVMICVFLVMNLTESILLTQNSFLFIIFMTAVLMVSVRHPRSQGASTASFVFPAPDRAGAPGRRA